jgi:Abortive infection alpha
MAVAKITKALSTTLSPFVGGAAKELSGYLADNIRYLRWKNAVRILERTHEFCEERRLPKTSIPIKFLVPFLEAASLEEDVRNETISDMWAGLFATAVTAYTARHATYVDILKKLSSEDAAYLNSIYKKMMADGLCGDDGFDPDIWNVLDKQEAAENFEAGIRERGKQILDRYKKHGVPLGDEDDDERAITECAITAAARPDFVPVLFDLGYFNTEEWINGISSLFESSRSHLDSISNLCALNIFEKFECMVWYPRPHKEGVWAIRVVASFTFMTSFGFGFMKACVHS